MASFPYAEEVTSIRLYTVFAEGKRSVAIEHRLDESESCDSLGHCDGRYDEIVFPRHHFLSQSLVSSVDFENIGTSFQRFTARTSFVC